MKRVAFTLVEVLITLGIIGVVAAMTIPNLMTNIQKIQIENSLKRSYSVMNQAVKLSVAENDEVGGWEFPQANINVQTDSFLKKYIFPYLKVMKYCGTGDGCWAKHEYLMNGEEYNTIRLANYIVTATLIDGSNLAFYYSDFDNEKMIIYIDVNGDKLPNTRGKDIFEFWLLHEPYKSSYVVPVGHTLTLQQAINDCKIAGVSCSRVLMDNGWKFPKDYNY